MSLKREESLKAAVRRFTLENGRLDHAVARRFGVSPAEMHALDHLQEAGGMTPGRLGERLQLTSGAVTALVDRLEHAGLVERTPHPTDRRSTVLRLTERTHRYAVEGYDAFVADFDRAARKLSAAESAAIERFMDEAADIAAEHAARQAREARK